MQVHFGETLFDAAHHFLIPLELQVGMQPALHEHAGAAEFHGLADFLVDSLKIQHIAFGPARAFHRRIESAERAVLRAEIRVINIAVNNVSNHALRMVLATYGVRLHANADQVIGADQVQGLLFGKRHKRLYFIAFSCFYGPRQL